PLPQPSVTPSPQPSQDSASNKALPQSTTTPTSWIPQLQIGIPSDQTVARPTTPKTLTFVFTAVNISASPIKCTFSALTSRGDSVTVNPTSYTIPPTSSKQVTVSVIVPAGATIGQDRITFTGMVTDSPEVVNVYANIAVIVPQDIAPPVVSNITYLKNTVWVKTDETVSFTVTDDVAVDPTSVKVTDASGANVPVIKGSGSGYSFVAAVNGIYTITAKDTAGKSSGNVTTKEIKIDNIVPSLSDIRIARNGTTDYVHITNTDKYYVFLNTGCYISILGTDFQSGLKTLSYQYVRDGAAINESAWIKTENILPKASMVQDVPSPPDYLSPPITPFLGNIAIRMVDDVGNITTTSLAANGKFGNENILPSITATAAISGYNPNNWYSSVPFAISASDANSGIAWVEVLVNGTVISRNVPPEQANGVGGATLSYTYTMATAGSNSVSFRVMDKSGNITTTVPQTVNINNQSPTLVVSNTPVGWTKNSVTIQLNNTNASVFSPITYSYQKTGDTAWTTIATVAPTATATLTLSTNTNATYVFKATAGGLDSATVSKLIKIDKTIPDTANSHVQAQTQGTPVDTADGENGWYKTIPTLSIIPPTTVVNPNESSVSTMYKFALEANFQAAVAQKFTGVSPIISADGKYILEVYTIDEAGNESVHNTKYINVDTTMPQVGTITMRKMTASDLTGIWDVFELFSGNVMIAAPVTDAMSGMYNVRYQLVTDGQTYNPNGTFALCTLTADGYTLTVSPQFKGQVYFVTKDNAGNTKTIPSQKLIADAVAPTTPLLNTGGYISGTWTDSPVMIGASGSTALSGIKGYYYRINGAANPILIPAGGIAAPQNAVTTYAIYAMNNLGMLSSPVALTVKNDSELPTITAVPAITTPTNGDVPINMTTSAGICGIESVKLSIDGAAPVDITSYFTAGVGVMQATRNGTYVYTVTNNVGVTATATCTISNIDKTVPQSPTYTVMPDQKNPSGNEPWRTQSQTITIVPPPQGSGSTITTYYKLFLTGTSEPAVGTVYTAPINVSTDGVYTFKVWAQNASGTLSGMQTRQLSIDKSAPQLAIAFDTQAPYVNSADMTFTVGDIAGAAGAVPSGTWYIKYTLHSSDAGVADQVGYMTPTLGQAKLHITAPFNGTVIAQLFDTAGNSITKTSDAFSVAKGITVTTAVPTSPANYAGQWISGNVTYALSTQAPPPANTAITGYEVSTDGLSWSSTGIVYSSAAGTATYTVSTEGSVRYYFRVLTEYTDPISHAKTAITGVSTSALLTQIDRTVPNTPIITITPAPYAPNIYNQTIGVSIAAEDNTGGSGIRNIMYSLDNQATWILYTGPFNINPQFSGKIMVKAADMSGNEARKNTSDFVVDATPPTAPVLRGISNSAFYDGTTWTAYNAVITPSGGTPVPAVLGFSGIANYQYSTDGGTTWTNVAVGGTITISNDGVTNVSVRAVSAAGITGPISIFTVKKDAAVPDITVVTESGGAGYNGTTWTSNNVVFTLSTRKTYASPYHYEYKKSTDALWTAIPFNGNVLSVSEADVAANGIGSYDFRIVTGIANVANPNHTVKIDKVVPRQTVHSVTGTMGQNGWHTAITAINVPAVTQDVDNGIRSAVTAKYSLYHPGSTPPAYVQGTPTIAADGTYVLDLMTIDEAKNANYTDSQTIKLDGTKPIIDPIAFEPMGYLGSLMFPGSVRVVLSGSDVTSGIDHLEYQAVPQGGTFNNINWQTYGLLYIAPTFKGTLYARAIDRAGNVSGDSAQTVQHVDITVDVLPPAAPVLSGVANSNPYVQRTWESGVVTINIADGTPIPVAGIDHYQYNTDDGTGWHDLAKG
ncbi:MAG: hypothetical protein RSC68_12485, partial [Acinetobacter sp.]